MKYLKTYENQSITLKEFIDPNAYWYYKGYNVECILNFIENYSTDYKFFVFYINTNRLRIKYIKDYLIILSKIRPATKEEIDRFVYEVELYKIQQDVKKYNI